MDFDTWLEDFTVASGVVVQQTKISDLKSFYDEVLLDVGTAGVEGAGLYDMYLAMPDTLVPETAEGGGVLDMTDLIRQSSEYANPDIFYAMRQHGLQYAGEIVLAPFDADFRVAVVKTDLLNRDDFTLPASFEDLVELAEHYHDTDINGDGVLDAGMCSYLFLTEHFWPILAPYLQSHGTSQGVLFETDTFADRFDTEAFELALGLFDRLRAVNHPDQGRPIWPATGYEGNASCAYVSNMRAAWFSFEHTLLPLAT